MSLAQILDSLKSWAHKKTTTLAFSQSLTFLIHSEPEVEFLKGCTWVLGIETQNPSSI